MLQRRNFLRLVASLPALPLLSVQRAQAREATQYAAVLRGRPLVFPRDHGAHPDFRNEWWYATGWLELPAGRPIGFQATFFRVRTGIGENSASAFAPRQLVLAHAALADPRRARLIHDERSARAAFGRAGFEENRARVWVGDWRFEAGEDGYRVAVTSDNFAYALTLKASAPPLPNGAAGFSAKAADERHASYYYSEPQLAVQGSVTLGGTTNVVKGRAWLDHEWSSELMPEEARGWDWTGINLDGGAALMLFRLRDATGKATWSGGSFRDAAGTVSILAPSEVAFEPLRRWQSARTGVSYPVEWRLKAGARVFELKALFDDQELDSRRSTGTIYWEGAARLFEDGREIGRGYLEMTGYSERLRLG